MSELGERMAALAASFEAEKEYQHERWHKLDNDLTPVIQLPEKLTRDIARMQGLMEGRMEAAIEKAMKPVVDEISSLKTRVGALETSKTQISTARMIAVWVIQTVLAAIVAVVALGKGQHP